MTGSGPEQPRSARVALPEPDEPLSDSEEQGSEDEDGDFLEEFPDDTPELDLLHSRIGSLAPLRLERFKDHLTRLCLRQNHITTLDPSVFHLLTLLEELDLYDNKIKGVGNALDRLEKLSVLDLSFNLLKGIPDGLSLLKALDTVYFVQNRISKITNLESCANLRSLELGGNRIRTIEGLDSLGRLEELWLGKNKISKLENLSALTKLKTLSIQSNRITKLEGLEQLADLEELYISHNGIEKLEGVHNNLKLKTLDVGSNFIPQIENISHLSQLEELWISGNKIPDFQALEPQLGSIKTLETLYLEDNPCQKTDPTGYRRKIMLALPQLSQIDATHTRQV